VNRPIAPYELVLRHDQTIDVEKIHAELKDGVLRVLAAEIRSGQTAPDYRQLSGRCACNRAIIARGFCELSLAML